MLDPNSNLRLILADNTGLCTKPGFNPLKRSTGAIIIKIIPNAKQNPYVNFFEPISLLKFSSVCMIICVIFVIKQILACIVIPKPLEQVKAGVCYSPISNDFHLPHKRDASIDSINPNQSC